MEQVDRLAVRLTRRRAVALGGAAMAAGMLGRHGVLARGAANETMGYPAITVTIDDKAISVPARVPAGLTFVTVKNAMAKGGEHMIWGRLPDGVTKDDVMALMASTPAPTTPSAQATPSAEVEFLDRLTIAGGPDWAMPGKDAQGIVNFKQGTYVLLNVFGAQVAFFDVVAPGTDAKTEAPKADIAVTLQNMSFGGLDQGAPAGKRVWRVTNVDGQAHELAILSIKPGTTARQVLDQLQKEPNAPFEPVAGNSILSAGQTAWQLIDLKPGSYAALCMVPDHWQGMPHAFMGMIKVFEAK